MQPTRPVIRARRPDDLESCVRVLAEVQAADGYPVVWPPEPGRWLRPVNEIAAWVAERDAVVVGHAVLRGAAGTSAAGPLVAATGRDLDGICMVARLFVAPSARRAGIAAALVAQAESAAHAAGLLLGLDVVAKDLAAIALYERAGWRRVATVQWTPQGSSESQPLHCYLAPSS